MGIKLGNLDISSFKVGGADCSIYLGDTKLYPTEEPTPQCNVPATATWHTVDDNFNRNTPIYGVSFYGGDGVGGGIDYQLEVRNQSNITYNINCHIKGDDSDSDFIAIYNDSTYRQIDNTVTINSFCEVFGEPMYISDNATIPSYEMCGEEECTEYDEETGECISSECISTYAVYFITALY
jgi:hypothetical protein